MKRLSAQIAALVIIITILPVFGAMRPPAVGGAPESVDEYYDMLILGIDRRPHEKNGRSDVILIVHCEPGRLTFFSIPRDTVAPIKGRRDKINAAYSWGGINLARSTIENFLKFKVDNYLVVDFQTFMKTVDVIKKLTDDGRLIGAENFLASGDNLLKWLRWRGMPTGDRRRCQRHQLFMSRVFGYTQNMYLRQASLFEQCMKAGLKVVSTDLTYEHVQRLYDTYKNTNVEKDIEKYVLPGTGRAYYKTDETTGENALTGWYYYEKYNWPLETYIRWYRKYNMTTNYVEEDSLRK